MSDVKHTNPDWLRTWVAELLVVASVLAAVVAFRHAAIVEWIGSAAVLASFAHGQVSDRLAEREGLRERPDVDCWKWSRRYFVMKESLWAAFFFATGAWSALVGVGVFLLYPAWRSAWRRRHPVTS